MLYESAIAYYRLSLTLREKQELMLFKNKMLRNIIGVKREEITGELEKVAHFILHLSSFIHYRTFSPL